MRALLHSEPVLLSDRMEDLEPQSHRSPGRHVSDVIQFACVRLGIFDPKVNTGWDPSTMILGKAVERAYRIAKAERHPERFLQGGEVFYDGMYGTFDLLDLEVTQIEMEKVGLVWAPGTRAIDEVKCTMMGTRDADDPALWRYWVQLMAYCWMARINIGRLAVVFWRGRGQGSQYRQWIRAFTDFELQSNWVMLKSYEAMMPTLAA